MKDSDYFHCPSILVDFILNSYYNIVVVILEDCMSLAIFYDPCSRCEHKDTKKMCNMCLLTYLKNMHPSVEVVTPRSPKELNPDLYKSVNWEKMNDYVDEIFDNIRIKLEEQNNEQRACQVEQSSREDN